MYSNLPTEFTVFLGISFLIICLGLTVFFVGVLCSKGVKGPYHIVNRKFINRTITEENSIKEHAFDNSYGNMLKYFTPLKGVFEVHITVEHKHGYVQLLNYAKKHEKTKGMKVVFAASIKNNNQYMLSYFTRKDDDMIAVENAKKIVSELEHNGINVLRLKVEGHGVIGTPITTEDYLGVSHYLKNKYNGKNGVPYFEFHAKVSNNTKFHNFCYENLERDASHYKNVAISHNLCSGTKLPLLTVRVYDVGFLEAQTYKDHVLERMKNLGYIFVDKIQEEFSIYDSNSSLDDGWLFNK